MIRKAWPCSFNSNNICKLFSLNNKLYCTLMGYHLYIYKVRNGPNFFKSRLGFSDGNLVISVVSWTWIWQLLRYWTPVPQTKMLRNLGVGRVFSALELDWAATYWVLVQGEIWNNIPTVTSDELNGQKSTMSRPRDSKTQATEGRREA